jgi:Single-stranded DNA-binding protein
MASRDVNRAILIGNFGANKEIRSASNGNTIANLHLATSETWKDQRGQQEE